MKVVLLHYIFDATFNKSCTFQANSDMLTIRITRMTQ